MQAEARRRLAGRGFLVDAAASGNVEAVGLHVIDDAEAVNVRDR